MSSLRYSSQLGMGRTTAYSYDQRISDQGDKYIIQLKTDDYQENEFSIAPRYYMNQLIIDAKHSEEDNNGGYLRPNGEKISPTIHNQLDHHHNVTTTNTNNKSEYGTGINNSSTITHNTLAMGPINESSIESTKPFDYDLFHRSIFCPQIIQTTSNEKNIHEKKLLMSLDLSDYQPEDIKVSVQEQELIVKAERKIETNTRKSRTSFFQSTSLPPQTDIEHLKSNYIDGKLIIEAPYLEQRIKTIQNQEKNGQKKYESQQISIHEDPFQQRTETIKEFVRLRTPPTQFAVGPPSSSPRASLQSNNSASPNSDRNMSSQTRGRRPSMFDPIDPKELQQALYASAAAKANLPTNPSNEDELTRPVSRITISYDRDIERVFIDTLSFENLQLLDSYVNNNNTSDFISFYCRFRLLPEKRTLFQTKIVRLTRLQSSYLFDKKQLNEFELSYDQLNNRSIEIFLYKISTIKPLYKDIRIATVKYDLNELSEVDQSRMKKPLEECDASSIIQDPDLGELLVSLSYLQSAAKLSVVIIEAKNLRPLSIETKPFPDACVKVTLYDRNGKKMKRKKTSVQRTSDCPTFNEELVFELRRDFASEVTIELRLVHESLSCKEQLGSVIFGPIINHTMKGPLCPENVYWSTVLSGQSLNAQWQILKPSIKTEESK
ncbi:unnamed protein product [Rotaria sp. Silwood2]|nr:unnamed protein product [Rotaria sp. Silwood2]